jgi:murein DD-endopeptidase MepM/ murein hydrolase activator NlpD
LSLHFSPSIEQEMTVTRTTEGGFTAELVKKELQAHSHRAGGTIDSSLYLAAMQAGIPADVVVDMIRMFLLQGGLPARPASRRQVRSLLRLLLHARRHAREIRRHQLCDDDLGRQGYPDVPLPARPAEPAEYFDSQGESAKGLLMKTPVDGARISSGFGSRFHPILGYTRMHKGVDFAVPTGTPVMAAGAGTIQFMGRASGYGNFVKISHGNGYSTDYGHLSRFAPGMRRGARLRQGQSSPIAA